MDAAINIGVSEAAVKEARQTIVAILTAEYIGDNVKCLALETLQKLCSADHAVVQNCTFDMGHNKSKKKK